jgi:hypothetical protein
VSPMSRRQSSQIANPSGAVEHVSQGSRPDAGKLPGALVVVDELEPTGIAIPLAQRRLPRPGGTVLALPPDWVSTRWIFCPGPASI